jgi:Fe-S oxidoreductase
MKTEFLYQYRKQHGIRLFDRLVAYLPRYAPIASKFSWVLNARDTIPGMAKISEWVAGFSAERKMPVWSNTPFNEKTTNKEEPDVILWADTFNRYFDPENLHATLRVLKAGGYKVKLAEAKEGERDLCCGRTFLAAGLIDEAKFEARRVMTSFAPYIAKGIPIVGLEPSCLLTLRDEYKLMLPGQQANDLADNSFLIEEFLARELEANRLKLNLKPTAHKKALLHGHCHQKAFAVMGSVEIILAQVPDLKVETINSSCCGMAGAFGYEKENIGVSNRMAEANLLPAVRAADSETIIVADGTSCRHQIEEGSNHKAVHVMRVLDDALASV